MRLKFTRTEECLLNARIELSRAKSDPARVNEIKQLEFHVANFEKAVAKEVAKKAAV